MSQKQESVSFPPASVLRSRRRLSRDKRVEELEKRLAWMEGQLRLPPEGRQFPGDFSKPGIDSKVQPQPVTSHANTIDKESPSQQLPSKEKALHLITIYFQGVNLVYPIFDPETFMSKFDSTYGIDCSDADPGWWAALNIVLAIAYQYWDMSDTDTEEDIEAWGYFQNAFSVVNRLITTDFTLTSVQALLGMAMAMMAMPHQRPITLLSSSAMKIAQSLGLHRKYQDPALSAVESAERLRVFWVAYSLDRDVSLQMRQPPTQSDEDMDIELPSESDQALILPGRIHSNIFYFRTRLAIIQSQIYKGLLSVKAGNQSASERAIAAEELGMTLQNWRRSVPIELFRDYSGPVSNRSPSETSRHPVYLQLLYFKTLAVIQDFLSSFPWYQEIQSSEVRVHIWSAPVAYPAEARSAMKLFNVTPRRKLACVWTTLHVFLTAARTLLMQAISNPVDPFVQADLELLEPFGKLLVVVTKSGVDEKVKEMCQSSLILFDQARMAASHPGPRAKMQQVVGRGDPEPRESVEDFLERMEQIKSGELPIPDPEGFLIV